MLFRALLVSLALPVVVGGLFPWYLSEIDCWRTRGTALGWPMVFVGVSVLVWCVRDFYAIGKGTLAPWDPPKKLLIVGLYRFMRNPMYVGVLGCVAGWSLIVGSPLLAGYTGILGTKYRATVNRWLPKTQSKPVRSGGAGKTSHCLHAHVSLSFSFGDNSLQQDCTAIARFALPIARELAKVFNHLERALVAN